MASEYGNFYCRVCGGQVFVPLSSGLMTGTEDVETFELTCFNGHTDQYEFVKVDRVTTEPTPAKLNVKSASAAIG